MADGTNTTRDRLCPECDTYRWPHEFAGKGTRGALCLECKETRKQQTIAARCEELMRTLPQTQGRRRLIAVEHEARPGHSGYVAVVECACSSISRPPAFVWRRGRTRRANDLGELCKSCAGVERVARSRAELGPADSAVPAEPAYMARVVGAWAHMPPDRDPYYQAFIDAFERPATLQEVAEFYGLSRERIRQIEAAALAKLKERDTNGKLRSLLEASIAGPTGMRNCPLDWDELPTFAQDPRGDTCRTQEQETDS